MEIYLNKEQQQEVLNLHNWAIPGEEFILVEKSIDSVDEVYCRYNLVVKMITTSKYYKNSYREAFFGVGPGVHQWDNRQPDGTVKFTEVFPKTITKTIYEF